MMVGLFGAGPWGRTILGKLRELGVDVKFVASRHPTGQMIDETPWLDVDSACHLIRRFEISKIIVAVPIEHQEEVAKKCFNMGADVLVEKPGATSMGGLLYLSMLAELSGRRLVVGYQGLHELRNAHIDTTTLETVEHVWYKPSLVGTNSHERLLSHELARMVYLTGVGDKLDIRQLKMYHRSKHSTELTFGDVRFVGEHVVTDRLSRRITTFSGAYGSSVGFFGRSGLCKSGAVSKLYTIDDDPLRTQLVSFLRDSDPEDGRRLVAALRTRMILDRIVQG